MRQELKEVSIQLFQFQLESNAIMKKYMPDKLGSDAFKAEMLELNAKFTQLIDDCYVERVS